jgi:hypothetical protein
VSRGAVKAQVRRACCNAEALRRPVPLPERRAGRGRSRGTACPPLHVATREAGGEILRPRAPRRPPRGEADARTPPLSRRAARPRGRCRRGSSPRSP